MIETERSHDFIVFLLYYAFESLPDPSKSGVVRMCVFVLQTLSAEPKFGTGLNKVFEQQNSLPLSIRLPDFRGSYADFLVIVRNLLNEH